MTNDIQFQMIRLIEQKPEISQRDLSRELGISLGKANYCLKALIDKGWVKVGNFRNSRKLTYRYLLTPQGLQHKALVTRNFLQRKLAEYEQLQREIESLRAEVEGEAVETINKERPEGSPQAPPGACPCEGANGKQGQGMCSFIKGCPSP